jgi:hypothetical protein
MSRNGTLTVTKIKSRHNSLLEVWFHHKLS